LFSEKKETVPAEKIKGGWRVDEEALRKYPAIF
jgi:hypothetical protein